ncbi:acetyl-CoA C-acyltransferase [Brumimicrobium sp.]|uniref:acetyl-CoA C-acyltransferase n=1 Tax=Brumimicrobium sp. TaxID=2029867 RepID=UPI0026334F48|nr:acetyl-CoA C-acyltransferase [uncultured Brumimicrobium sp.]
MSKEVYIIDGVRTPIGSFRGSLSTVRPDDMAALVMKTVVERNSSLDPNAIEDVIFGCANQAGEDNRNVARMSLLLAGLPNTIGGETVNRLCASGLSAAVSAARAIKDGAGDVYLAGGVENMTRGPWVMSKSAMPFGSDAKLYDSSFGWRFINAKLHEVYGTDGMGQTAENLVTKYGISREDQDQFAAWSQQKAEAAWANGRLAEEVVAVEIPRRKQEALIFDKDEFMRPGTTVETLSKLRPAFKKEGGSVTAGNSSGLNDGAGALLLASEQGIKDHQLKPMARFVGAAVAGVEPRIMGIGPVYAANKLLKRTGLTMNDMDVIELNEAFAAQALSCTRAWGLADNDPRLNRNGGAIALGHPLGMTGSRILQSAAIELQKTQKKYALVTLCIGVGQGYAAIIERV